MMFYYIAISAILLKQLGSWLRTLPTTIIDQKLSSILHLAKKTEIKVWELHLGKYTRQGRTGTKYQAGKSHNHPGHPIHPKQILKHGKPY